MIDNPAVKPSTLPVSAASFIIFLIVSWVLRLTFLPYEIFAQLPFAVIFIWSAKLLFDLLRWLRTDKHTRPKMRFPFKTTLVLCLVVLPIVYFGYLVVRDMHDYL
jgi:hypothetical protein